MVRHGLKARHIISPPTQKFGQAGSCHVESVHEPRKYSQPATGSLTTHSLLLAHCEPGLQHMDAPLDPHATAPASTLPSGQKHCCAPASVVPSRIRRSVSASERWQTSRRMSTGVRRRAGKGRKSEIQPTPGGRTRTAYDITKAGGRPGSKCIMKSTKFERPSIARPATRRDSDICTLVRRSSAIGRRRIESQPRPGHFCGQQCGKPLLFGCGDAYGLGGCKLSRRRAKERRAPTGTARGQPSLDGPAGFEFLRRKDLKLAMSCLSWRHRAS